jgi:hypothetical protein
MQRHLSDTKVSRSERRKEMAITRQLDPELAAPLETWFKATKGGIDLHDVPAARHLW